MLKPIIAFIFLATFALQTFSKVCIVLDYYTRTAAFAKNCVNKARPKLHCNGKCQMMKKLQEEQTKEEQNPERKAAHKNELTLYSQSSVAPFSLYGYTAAAASFCIEVAAPLQKMPKSIFHPPGHQA